MTRASWRATWRSHPIAPPSRGTIGPESCRRRDRGRSYTIGSTFSPLLAKYGGEFTDLQHHDEHLVDGHAFGVPGQSLRTHHVLGGVEDDDTTTARMIEFFGAHSVEQLRECPQRVGETETLVDASTATIGHAGDGVDEETAHHQTERGLPDASGERQSPAKDRAEQEVHPLRRPQRRFDQSRDEGDDAEEHHEGPRRTDVVHEEGAECEPRTTGECDAEHSRRPVTPTIQSVLTDCPQRTEGDERAVGPLAGYKSDDQGRCQTDGGPAREARLRRTTPPLLSRGDVVHAHEVNGRRSNRRVSLKSCSRSTHLRRRSLQRELDRDRQSAAGRVLEEDPSAKQLRETGGDRQVQSGIELVAAQSMERREKRRSLGRGHTRSSVDNEHLDEVADDTRP